jgi:hypothetical protein
MRTNGTSRFTRKARPFFVNMECFSYLVIRLSRKTGEVLAHVARTNALVPRTI